MFEGHILLQIVAVFSYFHLVLGLAAIQCIISRSSIPYIWHYLCVWKEQPKIFYLFTLLRLCAYASQLSLVPTIIYALIH